jgi:hypothetical protein
MGVVPFVKFEVVIKSRADTPLKASAAIRAFASRSRKLKRAAAAAGPPKSRAKSIKETKKLISVTLEKCCTRSDAGKTRAGTAVLVKTLELAGLTALRDETAKYPILAAINLVNCIATAERSRPSA